MVTWCTHETRITTTNWRRGKYRKTEGVNFVSKVDADMASKNREQNQVETSIRGRPKVEAFLPNQPTDLCIIQLSRQSSENITRALEKVTPLHDCCCHNNPSGSHRRSHKIKLQPNRYSINSKPLSSLPTTNASRTIPHVPAPRRALGRDSVHRGVPIGASGGCTVADATDDRPPGLDHHADCRRTLQHLVQRVQPHRPADGLRRVSEGPTPLGRNRGPKCDR